MWKTPPKTVPVVLVPPLWVLMTLLQIVWMWRPGQSKLTRRHILTPCPIHPPPTVTTVHLGPFTTPYTLVTHCPTPCSTANIPASTSTTSLASDTRTKFANMNGAKVSTGCISFKTISVDKSHCHQMIGLTQWEKMRVQERCKPVDFL